MVPMSQFAPVPGQWSPNRAGYDIQTGQGASFGGFNAGYSNQSFQSSLPLRNIFQPSLFIQLLETLVCPIHLGHKITTTLEVQQTH